MRLGMTTRSRPAGTPHPVDLAVALVLLAVGAVASCVLAAAWLTMYVGPVPFPISVLASGAWSLYLVRTSSRWSDRVLVTAFPAAVWILTLVAMNVGPGGDTPVPIGLRGLALLIFGGLIPLWVATLRPSDRPSDR